MSDHENDTRPKTPTSNFVPRQRGDQEIRARANRDLLGEFTGEVKRGELIAKLSKDERVQFDELVSSRNQRLESELKAQARTRRFKEIAQENQLLKSVLLNHVKEIDDGLPFNARDEIKNIEDQAKANVKFREDREVGTIEREVQYELDQFLNRDRSPDRQHDPEQEH